MSLAMEMAEIIYLKMVNPVTVVNYQRDRQRVFPILSEVRNSQTVQAGKPGASSNHKTPSDSNISKRLPPIFLGCWQTISCHLRVWTPMLYKISIQNIIILSDMQYSFVCPLCIPFICCSLSCLYPIFHPLVTA